jgi:YD repeat-containing protein
MTEPKAACMSMLAAQNEYALCNFNASGGVGAPPTLYNGIWQDPSEYPGCELAIWYPDGTSLRGATEQSYTFNCPSNSTNTSGRCVCNADYIASNKACIPIDPKNFGGCTVGTPQIPRPISIGVGNKYLDELDYSGGWPSSLSVSRVYNSRAVYAGSLGNNWRIRELSSVTSAYYGTAQANGADNRALKFYWYNNQWVSDADVTEKLTQLANSSGWTLLKTDGSLETYNSKGKLVSVTSRDKLVQTFTFSDGTTGLNGGYVLGNNGNATAVYLPSDLLIRVNDSFGRSIRFGYNQSMQISKVTDPGGGEYRYTYDANANLVSVTYPDGSIRQYHYENTTYKNALTGITDERGVRYITYTYDAEGKAVGEVMAGGVESYGLAFGANQTTVTDPLGTSRTYNFQTILGVAKNTGVSQPGGAGCGPAAEAITYDANGNVASRSDFNGKKTTYAYDLTRNLETSRTEGLSGSGAALPETRTITTSWHPTWRLPVQVNEYAGASASGNPLRRTSTAYDDKGNIVSRSVTDVAAGVTRTWTTAYTYSVAVPGLILQKVEDGPRTDVADTTVTEYYPHEVCAGAALGTGRDKGCRGQVKRITNALGQVTQFTRYNAHGQVEEIADPNGVVTTLTYDLRQRLTSRSTAGETTAFQYDPVGQLTRLTQPAGSYIAYTYDGARRLTEVADNQGNRIAYTLDAAGNRTKEDIFDPQGALAKTLTRAYDALGRMQTLTGVGHE